MPLYEFICHDCNCEQEILVRGSDAPVCSKCGGQRLAKLLSIPAAHSAGATPAASGGRPAGSCGTGCGCHPH